VLKHYPELSKGRNRLKAAFPPRPFRLSLLCKGILVKRMSMSDSVSEASSATPLQVKDESISPRWAGSKEDAETFNLIHWVGVTRDNTLMAFYGTQDSKISKIADRLLKKEAKTGWDYYTYAVQSQKRLVHAVKFHIYERRAFPVGKRVKLRGLAHNTFLNGMAVRILEYHPDTDKYLIRPTIPLPEERKLSSTGQLLVKSEHLLAETTWDDYIVWSFCAVFNGKKLKETDICTFVEKLVFLSEEFRATDAWKQSGKMSCQTEFGPILKAQIDLFCEMGREAFHDHSLELSNEIVAHNLFLLSKGSEYKSPAEKAREQSLSEATPSVSTANSTSNSF
jgi:hypothetical protein